jgi:transposase
MRDRGPSIREIAEMAGIGEKLVRELIRTADATPAGEDVSAVNGQPAELVNGSAAATTAGVVGTSIHTG